MTNKGLFGLWFCLLAVGFLVWPCLAQVPKPAQCLISGIYNLLRLPDHKDDLSCWKDCFAEPDCHMAVVTKPLTGYDQCLLVNCLNQGKHSYRRDPSKEIAVYPKSTTDADQREDLMTGAYGAANERFNCFDFKTYSSCQSGSPRFFYNTTSYRCEHFYCGRGSNRSTFDTKEGCEALCNETFRCYRPMQYGGSSSNISKFFYNMSSQRCERFSFSGRGSNGNIFDTAEECAQLCGDVKATTTSQSAVDTDNTITVSTDTVPAKNTATTTSPSTVDSDTTATVPTDRAGTSSSVTSDATASTSQPAVDTDNKVTASTDTVPIKSSATTTSQSAVDSVYLSIVMVGSILLVLALVVVFTPCHRMSHRPSPIRWQLLKHRDEYSLVESREALRRTRPDQVLDRREV